MTHARLHSRGVVVALTLSLLVACPAAAAEVVVALVRDGAGPDDRLVGLIEQELVNHTPRGTTVRLKTSDDFDAWWKSADAPAALQAALDDGDVDVVLAIGSLVTQAAARFEGQLPKPVVSTFVQRSDVFRLPYSEDGESLKANLNFVVIPQRAGADVQAFRDLVHFDTLHVAITAEDLNDLDELVEGLQRYEAELGVELSLVPITTDIDESMLRLRNANAVYLTRLQRLTTAQRRDLIERLNRQQVPTFSMLGHPDVELGALAGVTPDIEAQLVRRIALNLGRLMRGKSTADLPVVLSVDTRLRINARTANAIGYRPGRETRIFAEFIHPEELRADAEPLTAAQLIELAVGGNKSLRIVDSEVDGFREDQGRARSQLLPQLSANAGVAHADTDMTDDDQSTFGSVVLQQQIYDDTLWSSYRSSSQIYRGAEEDRETARLDVVSNAGQAYYQLALAQALYAVATADLRLTEDNLELARLRKDVGYSGREEVLRWEAVRAERRSSLFLAAETVEAARIALNQLLGLDQSRRWIPQPPTIDPDTFPALDGRLDGVFDNADSIESSRRVLVEVALENAPELRALDRSIEAQQIQVDQLRRRYFLPRFFAQAEYAEQLTAPDGPIFVEDDTFSVSLNAAYPLYQGGRRRADLGRARADRSVLDRQLSLSAELVERRLRTALQRAENSFPRIKFAREGARIAGENLELVREQYTEGTVNVTDLLDAQNQNLSANQFANIATYQFMGDLVELQRALGWFELEQSPEARTAFVERVLSAIAEEQR